MTQIESYQVNWSWDDSMKEVEDLRGRCCKRVVKACSENDTRSMEKYAEINSYFYSLMYVQS